MRFLLATTALLLSAPAIGQSTLPFEGKWTQADQCSPAYGFEVISKKEWTQVQPQALRAPDDVCNIIKVTQNSPTSFTVLQNCKDTSGDGPDMFKETSQLTIISTDKLSWKSSSTNQTVNLKRCGGVAETTARPATDILGVKSGMDLNEAIPFLKKAADDPNRNIYIRNTMFMEPGQPVQWFASNAFTGDARVRRPQTLSVVLGSGPIKSIAVALKD